MINAIPDKNSQLKIKIENIRLSRQNIKSFLEKRYNQRQVDIIMSVLKFPPISTYEAHWQHLDKFIFGETKLKKKLGFMLHQKNRDGKICPNDVFDLTSQIKSYDNLLSNDVFQLVNAMKKKLIIENKPPGYKLKQLNEEFMKEWHKKQKKNPKS